MLSLLYTLAETEENVNKYQQLFIRSVKKYLEKAEDDKKPENWSVLKYGDWSIIETIIGIEETKAIAQAVMEFLFLGYGNHEEYFEEYGDLFDCFCLNRKGFGEIRVYIDNICRATGFEGIAEMYGYVSEKEDDEEKTEGEKDISEKYGTRGDLTQLKITDEIEIGPGQEKIFENSKVIFANGMKLDDGAKLCFRNCEICLDGYSYGKNIIMSNRLPSYQDKCILLGSNCSIHFESCTIGKTSYYTRDMFGKNIDYFIYGGNGSKLTIENCCLDGCHNLFWGTSVLIKDSYINWIVEGFNEIGKGRTGELVTGDNIEVSDTVICESEKYTDCYLPLFEARQYLHIDKCRFKNCFRLKFELIDTIINDSDFMECVIDKPEKDKSYNSKDGKILFKDCRFQECMFKEEGEDHIGGMKFEKSGFISCIGQLHTDYMNDVSVDGGFLVMRTDIAVEINKCRFSNGSFEVSDNMKVYQENNRQAFGIGNGSQVLNCIFENMNLGKMSLIGSSANQPGASCSIENCTFININTKCGQIISRQYKYYKEGIFTSKLLEERFEVHLQNCTGL